MDVPKATPVAILLDRADAAPRRSAAQSALSAEDVADGIAAIEATYRRPDLAGVCVADGFGAKVTVERGALQVHDGIGQHRRTRRYDRATHGLRRVVIVQPEGFVTFEALRWCHSLAVGVLVLGADGTPTLASTPRVTDDARLRRTQALAPTEPVGLGVARYLLSSKVTGQALLVSKRFGDTEAAASIAGLASAIEAAETIEEARQLEASPAALYFGAWGSPRPRSSVSGATSKRHCQICQSSACASRSTTSEPATRRSPTCSD